MNLGVRLVARYLRQMAESEAWRRSGKKKAAALALAAVMVNRDELRTFAKAVFNERDFELVDVWVASYLKDRHGITVSNVTVSMLLRDLEAKIDELMKKSRMPHA